MIGRRDHVHARLSDAIARFDAALEDQPCGINEQIFEAVREVSAARNELIRRRRETRDGDTEDLLRRVNAALSILSSGEYPVVGVRLDRIRKGRDALAAVLE